MKKKIDIPKWDLYLERLLWILIVILVIAVSNDTIRTVVQDFMYGLTQRQQL